MNKIKKWLSLPLFPLSNLVCYSVAQRSSMNFMLLSRFISCLCILGSISSDDIRQQEPNGLMRTDVDMGLELERL